MRSILHLMEVTQTTKLHIRDWRRIRIQIETSIRINKNHINSTFNVLLVHLVERYHTSLADPETLSGPSSKKFLKEVQKYINIYT